jgi:hypothetical protein
MYDLKIPLMYGTDVYLGCKLRFSFERLLQAAKACKAAWSRHDSEYGKHLEAGDLLELGAGTSCAICQVGFLPHPPHMSLVPIPLKLRSCNAHMASHVVRAGLHIRNVNWNQEETWYGLRWLRQLTSVGQCFLHVHPDPSASAHPISIGGVRRQGVLRRASAFWTAHRYKSRHDSTHRSGNRLDNL